MKASKSAVSLTQSSRGTSVGLSCLLTLATIVVYSNTFDVPFLLDDRIRIEENPAIRTLWPVWAPMHETPRPIGMVTFAINYAAHGYHVWGYHATNLVIHILSGLTLFGIVRRTLLRGDFVGSRQYSAESLAFAIALLWLVHPLTTQAVTYIVQRLESLMGLCYLATLYCFIRAQDSPRRTLWYVNSIVCCAVGMGIKEVMITAPVMVIWYDRVFISRSWGALVRNHGRYYFCLFSTWGILAWCLVRAPLQFSLGSVGAVKGVAPLNYLLTQAGVITHYLRLSVCPYGQCFDYGWPVARTASEILPPLFFIGGLIAAILWAIFRYPAWGFLGGWFFVILGPTSSFVPIVDLAFEQRMYLPLAAVVAAFVFAIDAASGYLVHRRQASIRHLRIAGTCLVAIVVLQMSVLTWGRNELYRSEVGIWEDTVNKAPHSSRAHNNLAAFLHKSGDYDGAISHCKQALEISPDYADAHFNMGVILTKLGQLDAALAHYRQALAQNPADAKVHAGLGVTLLKQGASDEGIAHIRDAIALNPFSAEAHRDLGKALAEVGQVREALNHYQQALKIRPDDPQILYDVAVSLENAGRIDEAIQCYRHVVGLDPRDAKAHHNLGVALMTRGNLQEAISQFRAAIEVDSELAISHLGWGDALVARGQLNEAIQQYETALAIQPNLQLATDRLNSLHKKSPQ